MPAINRTNDILNGLTDEQAELLIRAYIKRVFLTLKPETPIHFHMRESSYDKKAARGQWTVGNEYSSEKVATVGEILIECAREQNRRTGWRSELARLADDGTEHLQIEHEVE